MRVALAFLILTALAPSAAWSQAPDVIFKDGFDPCPGIAESCFNGLDDDCNGFTDCEDAECVPVAECVPDPATFTLGTQVDDGVACPAGYDGVGTDIHQGLVAPPGCMGCVCSPLTCPTMFSELSGACPGGTVLGSVVVSSETCAGNLPYDTGRVRVTPMSSFCRASGSPSPTPAHWTSDATFCPALQMGDGCGQGSICAPRTTRHCALAAGDQSCPTGYTPEGAGGPWYTGMSDTRSCGSCSCTTMGGSCGTSYLRAFGSSGCTGPADVLPPGDHCSGAVYGSAIMVLQGHTAPSCVVGYSQSGSAAPTGDQTLCCR